MIHLYIQTLIDSYDPSGIQIIIPHSHSRTSNTSDTHSLSHTHIKKNHTHLKPQVYPSHVCQCVCMRCPLCYMSRTPTYGGINKGWHQNSESFRSFFWHKTELCASFSVLFINTLFSDYYLRNKLIIF